MHDNPYRAEARAVPAEEMPQSAATQPARVVPLIVIAWAVGCGLLAAIAEFLFNGYRNEGRIIVAGCIAAGAGLIPGIAHALHWDWRDRGRPHGTKPESNAPAEVCPAGTSDSE